MTPKTKSLCLYGTILLIISWGISHKIRNSCATINKINEERIF